MRVCVFSDIHGNYDSLKLLFNSGDFKGADIHVCLGDVVIMGPKPNECIEDILKNDCIWLCGNHDSYIANGLPQEELEKYNNDKLAHQQYMSNIIKDDYIEIMKKLPKDYLLTINGKKIYFTHYVWETSDNVIDEPQTLSLETVSNIFKHVDADYIFYGHDHNFSCFKDSKKEYICVGSLGLKYPGHYSLIDVDEAGNISVANKVINYDIDKFKCNVLKMAYPRAKRCVELFNE